METDETTWEPLVTEAQKVSGWRLGCLVEAGYPVGVAERIAARMDVDLHLAVELLENGCPPATAADILL